MKITAQLCSALLVAFSLTAVASTSHPEKVVLATSKIAGACGVLDSLIHFQATTKLNGGDEFVTRFWQQEAARLGVTVKELSSRCDKATSTYNRWWESSDEQ